MQSSAVVVHAALLDLEPMRALLESCYSPNRHGQPRRDPILMLRCLFVGAFCGIPAINRWVAHLKTHAELRVICGLGPQDKPPGVGTFYGFIDRIFDGPWRSPRQRPVRPSELLHGDHGRFARKVEQERDDDKAARKAALDGPDDARIKHEVKEAMERLDDPLPNDFAHRLELLLWMVGVLPSLADGLFEGQRHISVGADGSAVCTHASGEGKQLCGCTVDRCGCERLYSDAEAQWGWDHALKTHFFGYRIHGHIARVATFDLPLHIDIAPANMLDASMGIVGDVRVHKLQRELGVDLDIGFAPRDKGYDAEAYYKLLLKLDQVPVIPLKGKAVYSTHSEGFGFDAEGHPMCKGGVAMLRHAFVRSVQTTIYHCPAKYVGRDTDGKLVRKVDLSRCPLGVLCVPMSESTMKPLVYVRSTVNPRLHPGIDRSSPEFKSRLADRTATERYNSFAKVARGMEDRPFRRQHLYHLYGTLCAVEMHLNARLTRRLGKLDIHSVQDLFGVLEALLAQQGVQAADAA